KVSKLPRTSSEKPAAALEIPSGVGGSPAGKAVVVARLHISAVRGAPIVSRASDTKEAVSQLSFAKYCEKPPLLTSDSSAHIEEKTFCGEDWLAKSCLPNFVLSDSERPIRMVFLVMMFNALSALVTLRD